jgi:hypothetical protein
MRTDPRPWRRDWIARHFKTACLSRRCVDCDCGRSIELVDTEEAAHREAHRTN